MGENKEDLNKLSDIIFEIEEAEVIARAQLINSFYKTLDDSISESSKLILISEEFYPNEGDNGFF